MDKFMNYAFMLIFLLIVVAYFKGSIQVVGTLGDSINKVINTLQGRDKNGVFADYPNE
jgi:hypothetical protein